MENSAAGNSGMETDASQDAAQDAVQDGPGTPGRRRRIRRRVLMASVAGCAVLGGVLVLLPWGPSGTRAPGPAPGAQALAAVTMGVRPRCPIWRC